MSISGLGSRRERPFAATAHNFARAFIVMPATAGIQCSCVRHTFEKTVSR
jgi:hypothetical protein